MKRDQRKPSPVIQIPSVHDWRTTDSDEVNKRKLRAREESFSISNLEPKHPIFSNFRVQSGSGMTYKVEILDLNHHLFSCDCVDFRINGLGTCKHVEAVLGHLEGRFRRLFKSAGQSGSSRLDIVVDSKENTLIMRLAQGKRPRQVQKWFDREGKLRNGSPEKALSNLERLRDQGLNQIRLSQEIQPWLENLRRVEERKNLRHEYELKVQSGEWPQHETKMPLFPYQREGMLHLAFTERALLADEMGLGKTIQAIAACTLLHRLGQARHVLVITPASLKSEWEEQIQRFTDLPHQLVYGSRRHRLKAYLKAPFFTLVNYEQMLADALDVNQHLQPDVVVLDEAQRIKNWSTKTARAIKRLKSRYAFVLTGTPIENRIDELHSLMDFLNPSVLGPLFRFNRDFYELDQRGRPQGFRNLDQLHARIKPYMIRRRKADVETELPERTDENRFVALSDGQRSAYACHEAEVARLIHVAKHRPLTKQQQEKLQRELAMMRMICDTNYILDSQDRECPKLSELESILEECCENDAKVIIFSEWERMLQLARELCQSMGLGFAWHTGSVPQRKRRGEINAFKNDPQCQVFLSTDSGSTGLNLQNASVVINCDLPWNPAKLEQRIARAWRKHQTKPVTVFNLVSLDTIENRMLDTLANKKALADGVLDLQGDLQNIPLRRGQQAFLEKLEQMVTPVSDQQKSQISAFKSAMPVDRALAFSQRARERINGDLLRCEEHYPKEGPHTVLLVVVRQNPAQYRPYLDTLHQELFGPGNIDPLAPVQLQVIDRATDEAMQRLLAAGLLASATRSKRPLYPLPEAETKTKRLTAEQCARVQALRTEAARKLKMARLLGEGDLVEEARDPLLDGAHALARVWAIEQHLPEPKTLADSLLAPLSHHWGQALAPLRGYVDEDTRPWHQVWKCLDAMI